MFKNIFSFEGRIRRTEYGLSLILYVILMITINVICVTNPSLNFLMIAYIPMVWFLWGQGAKRCHDIDSSGWWQLIPFYFLWLLFQAGEPGSNQYGQDPKGTSVAHQQSYTQPTNPQGDYQGGYTGGHNNPNVSYESTPKSASSEEYKDGDLYN